jgi:hypothetical protein
MSDKISTTYNGVVISYDEYDNNWKNEETNRAYETPAKAREAIDRAAKVSHKMDPMPCIIRGPLGYRSNGSEFKKATITSFADDRNIWITFLDRKGEKVREKYSADSYRMSGLYTDTPENWALIEKLNSLWQREIELHRDIEKTTEEMKSIDIALEYKRLITENGAKEEAKK